MGGYFLEIAYYVDCLERGVPPDRVPLEQTAMDIEIAFAEFESAERGVSVSL